MTFEYWQTNYKQACSKIEKYDAGELALTKRDLKEAYGERNYWLGKCGHWHQKHGAVLHRWEDEFGSNHKMWYEEKHCSDCKQRLFSKALPNGGDDYQLKQSKLEILSL